MEKDNVVWKATTWQCHHLIQQGCSLHCSQLEAGSTILFSSASSAEPAAPLNPIPGLQESSFPRLGDMVWQPLLLSMPKPVLFHIPKRYYSIGQEIWRRALRKLSRALLNHRKTTDLKPSPVMITEMLFWMNLTSKNHINTWAKWCRKEWFRHKGGCAVRSGLFLVFVMTEAITSSKHLNMHCIMQYRSDACYLLCKPMSMQANRCTGCLIKNTSSI